MHTPLLAIGSCAQLSLSSRTPLSIIWSCIYSSFGHHHVSHTYVLLLSHPPFSVIRPHMHLCRSSHHAHTYFVHLVMHKTISHCPHIHLSRSFATTCTYVDHLVMHISFAHPVPRTSLFPIRSRIHLSCYHYLHHFPSSDSHVQLSRCRHMHLSRSTGFTCTCQDHLIIRSRIQNSQLVT
jgi:hypothetical protein